MTNKKDMFGDELPETRSDEFASIFSGGASGRGPKMHVKVGDSFRGEILSIGKEESFVSTTGAQDGVIPTKDLLDDKGQPKYKAGDSIEVIVVRTQGGEIRLSRKGSKAAVEDVGRIEDAFDMELPIEGKVVEAVKGGFRIKILGTSAFCPISQIDRGPVTDPSIYVGKNLDFQVTQMDEAKRNIIVSRRRILDAQRAEKEGEFLSQVKSGDILEGTVTRLETYGAFVEVAPSVEGLVHVSELAWGRVSHPSEILQVGMPVRVKVLKVEETDGRLKISLSVKQGGGELDPWLEVQRKYPPGTIVEGRVEKKESFGLFITLTPGLTGLFPRSQWRDSDDAAKWEAKKKGDPVQVQVMNVDTAERRISLGLPQDKVDESWREHAKAESSSKLGTFGDLLKAAPSGKQKKH